jgi:antitoxin ParD1/3/4
MTMNVNLSPHLEAMVKAKVASGLYTSASEVVREALRLMEQQDQLRSLQLQQLRSDIQEGLASSPRPLEPRRDQAGRAQAQGLAPLIRRMDDPFDAGPQHIQAVGSQ